MSSGKQVLPVEEKLLAYKGVTSSCQITNCVFKTLASTLERKFGCPSVCCHLQLLFLGQSSRCIRYCSNSSMVVVLISRKNIAQESSNRGHFLLSALSPFFIAK